MSFTLKALYGENKSYSTVELENAIKTVKLRSRQHKYVYAMFTEEEVCNVCLSQIRDSETARELRFRLSGYIFGSPDAVSYESSWNRFHDYKNEILGGLQKLGSWSRGGTGGSGGGWDGGGGGYGGDGHE